MYVCTKEETEKQRNRETEKQEDDVDYYNGIILLAITPPRDRNK
jgi:hypothetical protein